MSSINKFVKITKFIILFFFLSIGFNFLPIFKLEAANAYTSPGADNIISITDAKTNALVYGCARSSVSGGAGAFMRGLLSWISFDDFPTGCTLDKEGTTGETLNSPSILNVLGTANATIVAQRPASGLWYVQDKVIALNNIGKVDAQVKELSQINNYYPGAGADLLKPIYQFWGWSVRIVYAFMIVIIIFIAMAITFRQRLGGKAEVTLQNAIPSLAMAMIIIPLSYAISGFGIDMITIGTNVVHDFLIGYNTPGYEVGKYVREQNPTPNGEEDRGLYADDARVDWLHAREQVNISGSINDIGESVAQTTGLGTGPIWGLINGVLNMLSGNTSGSGSIAWFGTIVNFVISLTMIWIGVKIFFKLLKKYIFLTIVPMASAFILAPIALPGNGIKVLVEYIKQLAAAALHFIVAYAMFLLTIIFSSEKFYSSVPAGRTGSFIPPLLGFGNLAVGGSELTHLIFILVALGIYFSIPATLDGVDKALDIKDALPSFIKTPWDSFQESWKITTRAAPAFAARSAATGAKLARGAAYTPARLVMAGADAADRIRGKTPGEVGSYRASQRSKLATEKAKLQDQYDRAKADGNPAAMAVAETRMKGIDAYGDMIGTGVGFQGEKDQEPRLEVSGTDFTIQRTQLVRLITANGLSYDKSTGFINLPLGSALKQVYIGGEVEIYAKGAGKILNPVKLSVGRVDKGVDGADEYVETIIEDLKAEVDAGSILGQSMGTSPSRTTTSIDYASSASKGAYFRLDPSITAPAAPKLVGPPANGGPNLAAAANIRLAVTNIGTVKDKEKFKFNVAFEIDDLRTIIGSNLEPASFNPSDANAILTPTSGPSVRTPKLAYRIGGLESPPKRFTITLT